LRNWRRGGCGQKSEPEDGDMVEAVPDYQRPAWICQAGRAAYCGMSWTVWSATGALASAPWRS
jgi:hypothetical protein